MQTIIGEESTSDIFTLIKKNSSIKSELKTQLIEEFFGELKKSDPFSVGDTVYYLTEDKKLTPVGSSPKIKLGMVCFEGIILEISDSQSFNFLIGITNPINSEFGTKFEELPKKPKLTFNNFQTQITKFSWVNKKNLFFKTGLDI